MRLLAILAALLLAAATAVAQDCPPELTPTLEVDLRLNDVVRTADSAQNPLRDFKGLIIEEQIVREVTPLLLFVFFDSGSAAIPSRYRLLSKTEATRTFDESALPGGTLQKYYHVLDIVGSRMRRFPDARIQIVGCNSEQPQVGETIEVSRARGETLYRYLVDVWGIDSTRIKLLKPRGFPEARSNPRDPIGITENRRAEIRSTDWEINRPIVQSELRRYPLPAAAGFTWGNVRRGAAKLWIEVRRHGEVWARFDPVDRNSDIHRELREYNWGWNNIEDSIPFDEASYSFQLVVVDSTGRECRSREVTVPVVIIDEERIIREALIDRTVDRFQLIQFPLDNSTTTRQHERMISEYIVPRIRANARITVIRYEIDDVGEGSLSLRRQEAVARAIQALTPRGRIAEIVREKRRGPLYPEPLPESAFYSRAIQVIVENPVRTTTR